MRLRTGTRSQRTTGFFYYENKRELVKNIGMGTHDCNNVNPGGANGRKTIRDREKEVTMKLLLATFAVRVVIEMTSNKRREKIKTGGMKKIKKLFTRQSFLCDK
ncbi:MAG: hypothetical protein Q8941_03745 [Bacteroidota bacterium]|nr:hypothetical protein [Bacteroidota bacterium]